MVVLRLIFKILTMKRILLTFVLLIMIVVVSANNGITYQLYKNNNNYCDKKLEQIIKATLLEQFRAIDEDRIYYIEGYNVYIKLFSANYLKQKYNREISPLNIKQKNKYAGIRFGISEGKTLKPIF